MIVEEQWTPENDMVTAAMKIKRQNIFARYKDQINSKAKGSGDVSSGGARGGGGEKKKEIEEKVDVAKEEKKQKDDKPQVIREEEEKK